MNEAEKSISHANFLSALAVEYDELAKDAANEANRRQYRMKAVTLREDAAWWMARSIIFTKENADA